MRFGALQIRAFALGAGVIVLDQATKLWTLLGPLGELGERSKVIPVWGRKLELIYVRNYGVSYGAFDGAGAVGRWTLAAIAVGASLALAVWILRTKNALVALGAGLILGGAVGNVIDRIRLGYVVDFLAVDMVPVLLDYVFNIADVGITFGAALILIDAFRPQKPGVAKTF